VCDVCAHACVLSVCAWCVVCDRACVHLRNNKLAQKDGSV